MREGESEGTHLLEEEDGRVGVRRREEVAQLGVAHGLARLVAELGVHDGRRLELLGRLAQVGEGEERELEDGHGLLGALVDEVEARPSLRGVLRQLRHVGKGGRTSKKRGTHLLERTPRRFPLAALRPHAQTRVAHARLPHALVAPLLLPVHVAEHDGRLPEVARRGERVAIPREGDARVVQGTRLVERGAVGRARARCLCLCLRGGGAGAGGWSGRRARREVVRGRRERERRGRVGDGLARAGRQRAGVQRLVGFCYRREGRHARIEAR